MLLFCLCVCWASLFHNMWSKDHASDPWRCRLEGLISWLDGHPGIYSFIRSHPWSILLPAEVQEPLAPVSDLVVPWITRGHPGTTFPPQAAGFPLLPTHQGFGAHIVLGYGFQAHPGTTVSFKKCNPIATSPNRSSKHFHRSAAINSISKDKWDFKSSYVYSLTTYIHCMPQQH